MTKDVVVESELGIPIRCDYGDFLVGAIVTEWRGARHERLLLYKPIVEPLPLRIQSGCVLGFVAGDVDCDCRAQLGAALRQFEETGRGLLVYCADHDGRGRGLVAKLRVRRERHAHGGSSCDACMRLGMPYDLRDFEEIGWMLRHLGVRRLVGAGLSEGKRRGLTAAGLRVESTP